MPYKRIRNGVTRWYGAVMRHGIQKERVFDTKREAQRWETEMRETAKPLRKEIPSASLLEWATRYLEYSLTAHSRAVFTEKRTVLRGFVQTLSPDMPAHELTKRDVLDYLQAQAQKRSGHAANKDRKNLIAAWNWGIEYMGLPPLNPCKVSRFPEVKQPRYIPPVEDFWKAYEAADRPDQVLLLTFLYTAARRGEVFKLTWADVDFKNNRLRLFTRKRTGGNLESDWVEMVQELRDSLLWWWENRPHKDSEFVFTVHGGHTFENQHEGKPYGYRQHFMHKLCARAGVKPFGFHAIRHLTASLLDMAGKELTLIQGVLRHQNPHTTARYLHSLRGVKAELETALPRPPGKVVPLGSKRGAS